MENIQLLYINRNEANTSVMESLLSKFFKNISVSEDFNNAFKILATKEIKVIFLDLDSYNFDNKEVLSFFSGIEGNQDLIIYIICNECKSCKNKECHEILSKHKVKLLYKPIYFFDILNTLRKDLNIKI